MLAVTQGQCRRQVFYQLSIHIVQHERETPAADALSGALFDFDVVIDDHTRPFSDLILDETLVIGGRSVDDYRHELFPERLFHFGRPHCFYHGSVNLIE
jgi:hypothetical protein